MNDSWALFVEAHGKVLGMSKEAIDESIGLVACCGVNNEAGGFVENDEVLVFEVAFESPPPDLPGLVAKVAAEGLTFVRVTANGLSGLCSTRQRDDAAAVAGRIGELVAEDGMRVARTSFDDGHALVSAVGNALERREDVIDRSLQALEAERIDVAGVFIDSHTLGLLVTADRADAAVAALHDALMDGR